MLLPKMQAEALTMVSRLSEIDREIRSAELNDLDWELCNLKEEKRNIESQLRAWGY